MQRLTIMQLLPALDTGGVERSTLEINQALVNAGHRSLVVSATGRLVPSLIQAGGEHIPLSIGRKSLTSLRYIFQLKKLIQHENVDILHARSRLPAWLGYAALSQLPKEQRPHWVTTIHGLNSANRYSQIMTSGDQVICVSNTVRDYVLKHYPQINSQKLRVIPRGIDTQEFPAQPYPNQAARLAVAELHPELSPERPLLLLAGRGTRLKGHTDALQLLADLQQKQHITACLWLLGICQTGREDYIAELKRHAEQLGVLQQIAFTPATHHIQQAYAASDVVLQLSRKPEAFGRTVLEALSSGRPVIGWNHGGVGELLTQLYSDGAVPLGDSEALSHCVKQHLQHPPHLLCSIPFTLQAMQQATLSVYESFYG